MAFNSITLAIEIFFQFSGTVQHATTFNLFNILKKILMLKLLTTNIVLRHREGGG